MRRAGALACCLAPRDAFAGDMADVCFKRLPDCMLDTTAGACLTGEALALRLIAWPLKFDAAAILPCLVPAGCRGAGLSSVLDCAIHAERVRVRICLGSRPMRISPRVMSDCARVAY